MSQMEKIKARYGGIRDALWAIHFFTVSRRSELCFFVVVVLFFCVFVGFFFFFKHLKLGHGTGFQLPVEVSSLMEDVSSP